MERDVDDVLAGRRSYDSLERAEDRAAVRAAWERGLDESQGGVDLTDFFRTEGITRWVDIAPDGSIVQHSDGARPT